MGRGRSKAKQTKVARDLKYSNQEMDLERLAKELHGENKELARDLIPDRSNAQSFQNV